MYYAAITMLASKVLALQSFARDRRPSNSDLKLSGSERHQRSDLLEPTLSRTATTDRGFLLEAVQALSPVGLAPRQDGLSLHETVCLVVSIFDGFQLLTRQQVVV